MKPFRQEPLMVALRVRPMNTTEIKTCAVQIAHTVDDKLVVLMDPHDDSDDILRANRSREKRYVFDCVFDKLTSQATVYNSTVGAKDVIGRVMSGYNCTVFAYGATGTGKTYTMLGTDGEPGIMGLTLNNLFKRVEETKDEAMYTITIAYLEIYNDMVRDLLNPGSGILDLREDSNGEVVVSDLLEVTISSTREVLSLLRKGNRWRTSEPTAANQTSSRSHAILRIIVESRSRKMNVTQPVHTGVLFMVDLAGSERAAVTQNRGKRMVEGAHINRSLLALANCINALVSNNTHFVNYRDSKLTRLLKDALGGNCMTVMIAHISPASTVFEESRNTLGYAERGKKIKNKTRQNIVDVNYHITQYWHIIDELNKKVGLLENKLTQQRSTTANSKAEREGVSKVTKLWEQLKVCSEEEKVIRQDLLSVECSLLQYAIECREPLVRIREWEQKCHSTPQATPLDLSTASEGFSDQEEADKLPPLPLEGINSLSAKKYSGVKVIFETDATEGMGSLQIPKDPWENLPSEQLQSPGDSSMIRNQLPKPQCFSSTTDATLDSELVITPDSGTCTEVPSELPMEPPAVASSREELASLVASKQQMVAQHCSLGIRHEACRAKMASVKEEISSFPDLLPIHKELVDLLYHSCELEAKHVEESLTTALLRTQLGRHEIQVDQLLKHSSLLMEVVHQLQFIMEDQCAPAPINIADQCKDLFEKQRYLKLVAGKQIPLLGKQTQLPSLSRLPVTSLYTSMTGLKTGLSITEPILNGGKVVNIIQAPLPPLIDIQSCPSNEKSPDKDTVPFFSHTINVLKQSKVPSLPEPGNTSFFATDSVTTSLPTSNADKTLLVTLDDPLISQVSRDHAIDTISTGSNYDLRHTLKAAEGFPHKDTSSTPVAEGPSSCKSLSKEVLSKVVSLTATRSLDNKAKYIVPKSRSCSKILSTEFEGAAVGVSSKLQTSTLRASSAESMSSSKSHFCNQESTKATTSKGQTQVNVDRQMDIVQFLEPAVGKDPLSRNIVTMEQLMAITKGGEGKRTLINNTFLHKGGKHHHHVSRTKPNVGSKKQEVRVKTMMTQKQLPNLRQTTKLPTLPLGQVTMTLPDFRTNKVCLPSASSLEDSKRQDGPRRVLTKQKNKELHRRNELKITQVHAGQKFSNITSPYLTLDTIPQGRKSQAAASKKSPSWSRGKRLTAVRASSVWK